MDKTKKERNFKISPEIINALCALIYQMVISSDTNTIIYNSTLLSTIPYINLTFQHDFT